VSAQRAKGIEKKNHDLENPNDIFVGTSFAGPKTKLKIQGAQRQDFSAKAKIFSEPLTIDSGATK
jgi:hypothetical protein